MNPLELKTYPDPCLRIKTKPVDQFTPEIEQTIKDMADIMYINSGIGLAATQVGLGCRLLIIDVDEELVEFINPQIVESSQKKAKMDEGCLSLPETSVVVTRSDWIKVRFQNKKGEFSIKKFDALAARALQHEMDHLDGRLLIDYLNPVRRFIASRKLTKNKNKINF